ncbi:VanZ family protein [Microbacterium allomyrinae]|uniref:VanZ family protein n=1 Tax=Microbacterium allomyrinae TaxID=2830666 RepID=A0A9X1S4I0_9MICO|nr:VanZ family protein [Microbacterium allomyrinae]MCC2033030.1 VanZ family protein [Microbacterium allomyrinae]
MPRPRRRRWVPWALGAYGVAALVVLVSPLSPDAIVNAVHGVVHDGLGLDFVRPGWIELGLNIVLFAPVGLFGALLFGPWWGIAMGVALSGAAELVQLVLPAREPSLRDLLANIIGTAVGVGVAWLFLRRDARSSTNRRPADVDA